LLASFMTWSSCFSASTFRIFCRTEEASSSRRSTRCTSSQDSANLGFKEFCQSKIIFKKQELKQPNRNQKQKKQPTATPQRSTYSANCAFYRGMGSVAEQQTFLNIAHIYSINKGGYRKKSHVTASTVAPLFNVDCWLIRHSHH
jgi:hypothetical protein